jgi:uncharacterized protein
MFSLINARTGEVLAHPLIVANTRAGRRQGLLGRDHLDPSAALLLQPCFAVHTVAMRFAIDVVFLDKAGKITRIVRDLRPWRIAGCLRARTVVEFASGALASRDIAVGDRLSFHARWLVSGASAPAQADESALSA